MKTETESGFIDQLRADLRRLRRGRRYSQAEVGELLGVGQTAVAGFETGKTTLRGPSLEKAMALIAEWSAGPERPAKATAAPARPEPAAMARDTACPACGGLVPGPRQRALFCCLCGEALGKECRGCGHLNTDEEAMFCTACGAPLTEEAAEAKEAIGEVTGRPLDRRLREEFQRLMEEYERRKDEPEM